ncbi:Transthyretin-like protein 5 [Toxocara canis]|nr:Transthyretin-like protein 5 [Toxocara canis]
MCGNRPASNVLVKLYDNDRGIDRDDLMAKGKTDARGFFQLEGHTDEFSTIDPKLNIYHDCNDHLPCQRKVTFYIPDSYVSSGKRPTRIYDIGTIDLALKRKGESRDCIH